MVRSQPRAHPRWGTVITGLEIQILAPTWGTRTLVLLKQSTKRDDCSNRSVHSNRSNWTVFIVQPQSLKKWADPKFSKVFQIFQKLSRFCGFWSFTIVQRRYSVQYRSFKIVQHRSKSFNHPSVTHISAVHNNRPSRWTIKISVTSANMSLRKTQF